MLGRQGPVRYLCEWKGICCCLVAVFLAFTPCNAGAEDVKSKNAPAQKSDKVEEDASPPAVKPPPLKKLVEHSQELLRYGTPEEAAQALYMVHYYYPEGPKGEPSLWQAASMIKEMALVAENPDWDTVLDRFRRYLNYYPKAPRAADAYFELGMTYQAMHFFREAQVYFKLFLERYPDSPLVLQAMSHYRDSLLKAGREDEAKKVFTSWQKSTDPKVRAMGEMGEATMKWGKGDFQGALDGYQKILKVLPDYFITDLEVLRYVGIANLRLGKAEIGQTHLYHYLTLTGISPARRDVLLELAESYFLTRQFLAAQKLYRQIKAEGTENERAVLVSNFRLAQCFDNTDIELEKWQFHNDLTAPEGDKPYLAVLEKLYRDPIAQDARIEIFKRYIARSELGRASEVGRNFLRNAQPDLSNAVQTKQVDQILDYLVSELLKAKRYVDIYDLYVGEYRHVKDFPNGPLQGMIGQAMEALGLNDLAAALYYRAMQWPLTEQEKAELYFRRARLYLAMKDYEAEDRLLTYLRKIYQGKPEAGEVAYYSAQLSAARGDIDQAQEWYDKALDKPTVSDRSLAAEEAIGLMVRDGRLEQAETILTKGATERWIAPEVQQGWLLRIGNGWREKKEWVKAQQAYERGLVEGLPDKGETVQALQVYLGDVLLALDTPDKGLERYQAAAQGEDQLWKQMASERLTQHALDVEMAAMKKAGRSVGNDAQ